MKIAILGALRHWPRVRACASLPCASKAFLAWLDAVRERVGADCLSRVELVLPSGRHWDVKPAALSQMLERGEWDVTWIDSDIAFANDGFAAVHAGAGEGMVIVAEETH